MTTADWVPADVDVHRPSVARVYDFILGGSHNFAVDRAAARSTMDEWPDVVYAMRANRAVLRRAVRFLTVEAGIRQFIDLGSGIPTAGNVHEIAQATAPDARIAYVDSDPVAVAHGRMILRGNDLACAVRGDALDPDAVLRHPEVTSLIDLSRPVAVLFVAVLHFIPDEAPGDGRLDPATAVARVRDALAPGSYLALGAGTSDGQPAESTYDAYSRNAAPLTMRPRAAISRFFGDFTLVEPGLVHSPLWRPDPDDDITDAERCVAYFGVGRKEA